MKQQNDGAQGGNKIYLANDSALKKVWESAIFAKIVQAFCGRVIVALFWYAQVFSREVYGGDHSQKFQNIVKPNDFINSILNFAIRYDWLRRIWN